MRPTLILLGSATFCLCLSAGFALDYYWKFRILRASVGQARSDQIAAELLAHKYPEAFSRPMPAEGQKSLKALAQETAARHGLAIGYLADHERTVEKGFCERQVVVRLTQAQHSAFVLALADIERAGEGAKLKELHLKPSATNADVYDEAEAVFLKRLPGTERQP